jgi:hypothetical protein
MQSEQTCRGIFIGIAIAIAIAIIAIIATWGCN